jgi:hypothetical protein
MIRECRIVAVLLVLLTAARGPADEKTSTGGLAWARPEISVLPLNHLALQRLFE